MVSSTHGCASAIPISLNYVNCMRMLFVVVLLAFKWLSFRSTVYACLSAWYSLCMCAFQAFFYYSFKGKQKLENLFRDFWGIYIVFMSSQNLVCMKIFKLDQKRYFTIFAHLKINLLALT